jgi:hypothetical protein
MTAAPLRVHDHRHADGLQSRGGLHVQVAGDVLDDEITSCRCRRTPGSVDAHRSRARSSPRRVWCGPWSTEPRGHAGPRWRSPRRPCGRNGPAGEGHRVHRARSPRPDRAESRSRRGRCRRRHRPMRPMGRSGPRPAARCRRWMCLATRRHGGRSARTDRRPVVTGSAHCLLERVPYERGLHAGGGAPAHDPTGVSVEHEGHVDHPGPGRTPPVTSSACSPSALPGASR